MRGAAYLGLLVDWCLQVHGGAGFMHEQPISRACRDPRLQHIGGGTDQVMNEVIAKRARYHRVSGAPAGARGVRDLAGGQH